MPAHRLTVCALEAALDMNAAGVLCGTGWKNDQRHAYVAVPVP